MWRDCTHQLAQLSVKRVQRATSVQKLQPLHKSATVATTVGMEQLLVQCVQLGFIVQKVLTTRLSVKAAHIVGKEAVVALFARRVNTVHPVA